MKKSERIQLEFKRIEKRNKKFLKASPAEKRIMIAEDTLEQLESKKFIASSGVYFRTDKEFNPGKSLQDELIKKEPTCTVCQIGGLFASCVRISNEVKVPKNKYFDFSDNDINHTLMRNHLTNFFSPTQLILVECAFEEENMQNDIVESHDDYASSDDEFLKKYNEIEFSLIYSAVKFRERKGLSCIDKDFTKDQELEKDNLAMIAICKNIISNGGRFRPDR